MPAIATQTRSCHQANDHGLLSRSVESPCIHCSPVPASTVTSPVARSMLLSWWCTVSATYAVSPTTHTPLGSLNPPHSRSTLGSPPVPSSSTTRSCPASATSTWPPGRGAASAGNRTVVGSTTGGTYGASPGWSVPLVRCSPTSS